MAEQNADNPKPEASMNTEKETVTAYRDREKAEAELRKAQPRPASSGQLNPGAEEYRTERPAGPAGTDSTTSHASGTHHDRTHIDP